MKKRISKKHSVDKNESLCDWRIKPPRSGEISGKSKICRYKKDSFSWKGVKTEAYKAGKGDWDRIIRRTLVGDWVKSGSHLRYFEISPGGQSSFERHRHEHIVIGIRGSGRVLLEKKRYAVGIICVSQHTTSVFKSA
jgi:ribulose-bisphosphate carboxylase large chain